MSVDKDACDRCYTLCVLDQKGITTAYSSRCVPAREYLFDFCLEGRGEDAAPTKPSIFPDTWASFTFHHTQHQRFAMNHIVGAASPLARECLLDFWLKKFTPRFCPKKHIDSRQRLRIFSTKIAYIFGQNRCNLSQALQHAMHQTVARASILKLSPNWCDGKYRQKEMKNEEYRRSNAYRLATF